MIFLFGPVVSSEHLLQFYYMPEDLERPLDKNDHIIMFVTSSFFEDPDSLPSLEMFPFNTILVECDNNVYSKYLAELPDTRKYGGRTVKKISESVTCIVNCGVYSVEGIQLLVFPFGRAQNTASDKLQYKRHYKLRLQCRKLLAKENRKVDYVLSQIIPYSLAKKRHFIGRFDYNSLMLDRFLETYEYKKWFYTCANIDSSIKDKYFNVFRSLYVLD